MASADGAARPVGHCRFDGGRLPETTRGYAPVSEPFATGTPPPPVPPPPGPAVPGVFDERERTLDPAVVNVWRVVGGLTLALPLVGVTIAGFLLLGRFGWAVFGLALVGFLVLTVWYPPARYARWRWQLTALALELRYGVVVRRYEAVPYFRIQQIDITQGPLDRVLHLATLQVTTASASGSAALPGIAAADAPQVRAELLARASHAVADHPGDLQDAV